MKLHTTFLFCLVGAFIFLQSCSNSSSGPNYDNVPPPYNQSSAIKDSTTADGLQIYVISEGDTTANFKIVSRDQPVVRYTGRTESGKIIESSYSGDTNNNTYSNTHQFLNLTPITQTYSNSYGYQRTVSPLIDGLRRGILGMHEGEKRQLVIPPSLGYGDAQKGSNHYDLRTETLIYDVEIVRLPE